MKVVIAIVAGLLLAAPVTGCGGGGSPSVAEVPHRHEGIAMKCLEAREGALGLEHVGTSVCKEAGVTANSPSKDSQKAAQARAADTFSRATYARFREEEPTSELRDRSNALAYYAKGADAKAREWVEKSCTKAAAHELQEALSTVQILATEEPEPNHRELKEILREVCPL